MREFWGLLQHGPSRDLNDAARFADGTNSYAALK
jgi:hypothetical protein